MPKVARSGGVIDAFKSGERQQMTLHEFQKAVSPSWFTSQTAFLAHVVLASVAFPSHLPDSWHARALVVFLHYGLVQTVKECPVCKGPVHIQSRITKGCSTLTWTCTRLGHKHLDKSVNGFGILKKVSINNWMPFLNLLVLFWLERAWRDIVIEMQDAYGNIKEHTLTSWRRLAQSVIKKYIDVVNGWVIGSENVVVVIDESVIGWNKDAPKGIRKFSPARRTGLRSRRAVRKRILKRLPAKTLWKKPAGAVMKKPAGAVMKKPSSTSCGTVMKKPASKVSVQGTEKDPRANGRWMWAAVAVGKGSQLYTHENGLKTFTYKFLPNKSLAQDGKPRGLKEIRSVLQERVAKGSFLVFDKWRSTVAAVKQLGYKSAPPVDHSSGFRDQDTGFHSNDIVGKLAGQGFPPPSLWISATGEG